MAEKKNPIQDLFNHVFKSGNIGIKVETNRRPDSTYVSGFRNDIKTAVSEIAGYAIQAKRIGYQLMNPSADTDGNRYLLEVRKGDDLVFQATREGASSTKKFGAEERYLGTDTTEEQEWVIVQGTLPQELEALPA